MAKKSLIASPTLRRLERDLQKSDVQSVVLEKFWRKRKTPLFETLKGDNQNLLVTFLWRGDAETQNVLVISSVLNPDFLQNHMTRLGESDVWYLSTTVAQDVRTIYLFAPNDSLEPMGFFADDDEKEKRIAHWTHDPRNPEVYINTADKDDPKSKEKRDSILVAPHAKPQPDIGRRRGIPRGKVKKYKLESTHLGYTRRVYVYTPPAYDAQNTYPFLTLWDGWVYLHRDHVNDTFDNLIHEGAIPPIVALLVDSPAKKRNWELVPREQFTNFVFDELLPWARERWNLTTDPQQTVVAGSSLGGLVSSYLAMVRPDVFGKVLSQSGAYFWKPQFYIWDDIPTTETEWGWLMRRYVESERLLLTFYQDVGLLEKMNINDDGMSLLSSNRHFRDVLRAKGYPVHYVEFSGEHDHVWWRQTLADGLRVLLGNNRNI